MKDVWRVLLFLACIGGFVVGLFVLFDYMQEKTYRAKGVRCEQIAGLYEYNWIYDTNHVCRFETKPDLWLAIDTSAN